MSEPFESQASKTVPYCDDRPPQYDPCQPNQDVLTSVVENEHTRRVLIQRLEELDRKILSLSERNPIEIDYFQAVNFFLELGQLCTEGVQISTESANIHKERTIQNTELYTAMSRLTDTEFNRTYASLGRDSNRLMRHELDQDHEDRGNCYRDCGNDSQRSLVKKQIEGVEDCTCDSPCSRDRFFELSAKMDKINDNSSALRVK
ncbi:unnamed protein product [Penicillium nalgiovense]|uniref:Uncharacterized protein n=1 Tax=Penicillium nalgiovense TaxID=60175 RepID=A0A9W4HVN9_PENNA|nr:unnamed protein product [Penicillium nalgiovense]CAG7945924.1 unnamed protein product [Penicillium nalgiovense]CAG7975275.1 unnamed protein product [Penicillium nalgiovense]CAG8054105.1 unnamed protein product [Penicillium nalgiovense]CAG8062050.1 unnamed protein product [Penicillium nalgiovense]